VKRATVHFDGCEQLGAANVRGTGFASKDIEIRTLTARVGEDWNTVEVNVAGIAGLLLAKVAAARSRRAAKDWYDIAFVLLHNDLGGPRAAAQAVRARFAGELNGPIHSALEDLRANLTPSVTKAQAPTRNRCVRTILDWTLQLLLVTPSSQSAYFTST